MFACVPWFPDKERKIETERHKESERERQRGTDRRAESERERESCLKGQFWSEHKNWHTLTLGVFIYHFDILDIHCEIFLQE